MIEGRSREEMRQEEQARWEEMSIEEHMEHYLAQGMNRKDAMKQTAKTGECRSGKFIITLKR